MAARVILEMDVQSTDRAKKIRKAIQSYLGVDKVSVSPQTGLVVITGPAAADADMLRRLIQYKLRRPVSIVSDGGALEPVDAGGWMTNHWATPQFAPTYGGRVMPQPYGAPQQSYPYARSHWTPPPPPRGCRRVTTTRRALSRAAPSSDHVLPAACALVHACVMNNHC